MIVEVRALRILFTVFTISVSWEIEGLEMPFRWNPREHVALGRYFLKWLAIAVPVGAVIGTAVAIFLWALDLATTTRWNHPGLLYFLPLAGIGVGLLYCVFG